MYARICILGEKAPTMPTPALANLTFSTSERRLGPTIYHLCPLIKRGRSCCSWLMKPKILGGTKLLMDSRQEIEHDITLAFQFDH